MRRSENRPILTAFVELGASLAMLVMLALRAAASLIGSDRKQGRKQRAVSQDKNLTFYFSSRLLVSVVFGYNE